ncbi:hypothetical protein ACFVIM_13475 [Streptomyces sp. NPDC057638]|uniref:hypothetical protein n=1 Tax=Streptomyces sp. NPDC057638 TaxID=3346190 RepID=UPI00368A3EBA
MSNEDPRSRPPYVWQSAQVNSLGGPLLVCGLDAFPDWGGAVHDTGGALDPACDYARAWSALHPDDDDLDAAFTGFGDHRQHTGLIWEMDGEGSAEIARARRPATPAGGDDHFLIMRSWIPRGRTNAPRRRAAGASPAEEQHVGELELPSGRAVVVWAAVNADETGSYASARERAASLKALARLNPPVPLHLDGQQGLGTVLWVRPGTYRVTCGWHQGTRGQYMPQEEPHGPAPSATDDDWSCRWVRFTHRGGPARA